MRKSIIMALTMLPMLAVGAFAQGPNSTTTWLCNTSDGLVTISDQNIVLADYDLQFDSMISDGIVRYRDAGSGAVATLDARGDEGLYILISDDGTTMQVVASRGDVRYRFDENGSEASAPSLSSVLNTTPITAEAHKK